MHPVTMSDAFAPKSMKRKNLKGLALAAPPPRSTTPSAGDAQVPGAIGNNERNDTLEIGVEFQLDLRAEDLIVLKELGAGNGGTVSKVQHAATKVIMARKVCWEWKICGIVTDRLANRSYTSRRRRKYGSVLFVS